ncbi:MAG: hypothetical protein IKA34_11440 [Bacteroidales bacterium]|nr:hypothetical protein [Bacteroidales bacterium]
MTQDDFIRLSQEESSACSSPEEAWRAGYIYLLEEIYSACTLGRESRFLQQKCEEFFSISQSS